MVAGFERYFQIARAFRDEDQRGDRQPEFTQLDIEMSFVEQEDVLRLGEAMLTDMTRKLFSEKRLSQNPWPRLTYKEAMETYGTDKPDLRKDQSDPNELAFAWIVDFPMFEKLDDGSIQAAHHPFTMPHPEDITNMESDPLSVRALAYDIVLNGYEISSGSIRIHTPDLQNRVFKILGLSAHDIDAKFRHMLDAFEFGAPPHGGMAPGIDRLVMLLAGEKGISEVIAFPKTGAARDPMMGAPADISEKQLKELGIRCES
jgi:aspartyl-tRNA synthetase